MAAQSQSGSCAHRVAILDVGTVSVRFVAADVCGDAISELYRCVDVVQLGEGVARTGLIGDAALARLDAVLAGYRRRIEEIGAKTPVERVFAVATSAARDADNADELVRTLRRHGFELEVIDGRREAELTFAGMAGAFGGEEIIASDVGGGSTELIFGSAVAGGQPCIVCADSIDVGARRATELFLTSDPPEPQQLEAVKAWAYELLAPFFDSLASRPKSMVATAGVATTLVAVRGGLSEYRDDKVHGQVLTLDEVDGLIERLARLPEHERARLAGLQPQRAGIIVGGALVQRTVMALSGLESCTVSTQSLVEGAFREVARTLDGG